MSLKKAKHIVSRYHQPKHIKWYNKGVFKVFVKVDGVMRQHPWKGSVIFSTLKTCVADLMVQIYMDGTSWNDIDWTRNTVFFFFGFGYLGCFQYWLYNTFLFKIFPGTSFLSTFKKVGVDQLLHHPILYFPTFYATKEFINQKAFNINAFKDGMVKYKNNYKQDWIGLWTVWVPTTSIILGIIPMHMRMPIMASVSFLWTSILSFYRGKYDE